MFKMVVLMIGGILLMACGLYSLSITNLSELVFPFLNINWGMIGIVAIGGSIAVFGSAFIASKFV